MRIIHKYQIPAAGSGTVRVPKGAFVLFAREQHNVACIWALVDPQAEMANRLFLAAETGGMAIPDGSRYLGTCMLDGGYYVLHIFEPAQTDI